MTGKDLFREIGMISEEYIVEAESIKRSVITSPVFRKTLATAACLVLCMGLYFGVRQLGAGFDESAQDCDISNGGSANGEMAPMADKASAQVETDLGRNDSAEIVDGIEETVDLAGLESASEPEAAAVKIEENEMINDALENTNDEVNARDLEMVCDRFSAYPEDSQELVNKGLVVNVHGRLKGGQEELADFMTCMESGQEAEIEIVQYTIEGDPIFEYVHYDGTDFYVMRDSSRDAFAGSGTKVYEGQYKYLRVFEETLEGGSQIVEMVLTNETISDIEELYSGEYEYVYIMQYSKE